jgi:hypothetical protein
MNAGAPRLAAALAALAVVVAAGALANRRERDLALSPLPSASNAGPRGLAAARAWLQDTGRPHRLLAMGAPAPAPGEVLLLVAPAARLDEAETRALLEHAERGGLLVWAMGDRPQPALERALGVGRASGGSDLSEHAAVPLAPHPLFEGLVLRTGGASLTVHGDAALPVAGDRDRTSACSVRIGRGEAVVLAGPDALENFRLSEGGNLTFLARLAAIGPIAIDERHLAPPAGEPRPAGSALLLAAGQALLAAAVLLLALGRRLGSVRTAADPEGGRTALDYLASLGDLYRRAGSEAALRTAAWRSLRRSLERSGGVPLAASDDEAEQRLSRRAPEAARAFARCRAALGSPPGDAGLARLVRAAAETEAALAGRRRAG